MFAPEPTYVPAPPYFSAFRSGPIVAAAPKPKKVFYFNFRLNIKSLFEKKKIENLLLKTGCIKIFGTHGL